MTAIDSMGLPRKGPEELDNRVGSAWCDVHGRFNANEVCPDCFPDGIDDVIWIAKAPPGTTSSGPAVCYKPSEADQYRQIGWIVKGPYILVGDRND